MASRITVRVVSSDGNPVKVFYVTIDAHQTMQHLRLKIIERFSANYSTLVSPSTTFGKLRSVKGIDFCDEDRISDFYGAEDEKEVLIAMSSTNLQRSIEDDPEVLVQSTNPHTLTRLLSRPPPHRDADGFVIPNTPKRLRLDDAFSKLVGPSPLRSDAPPTPTSRSLSNRDATPASGQQSAQDPGARPAPFAASSDVSIHSSQDFSLPQLDGFGRQTPVSDVSNRPSVTPSAFSRILASQDRSTPSNKNESWSKDEDAQLMEGTRLGLSTSQIVKRYRICRSASAARSRRLLLEKKHPGLQVPVDKPPPSSKTIDDNDTGIAHSTRSQQWEPADEMKLKQAFRFGLDSAAITRQYFFRNRTFDSVNARYQSLERVYNQSRRNAPDWPKENLAVTGWGENENGRLHRAYMNSLDATTAHGRFFHTFSFAIVQSKYKAYSKQLAEAGLDRPAFDPQSPPTVSAETPAMAMKSDISSSVLAPDRSSPCVRAVSEFSALGCPISIATRQIELDSDDENSPPLKKSKAEGGQTFLNFKRSKGKGCDLPLADIRAELDEKYRRALSGVPDTGADYRHGRGDLTVDGPTGVVDETAMTSVEQEIVNDDDDDFYSAVFGITDFEDALCLDQDQAAGHPVSNRLWVTSPEAQASRPSTAESFYTAPEHVIHNARQIAVSSTRPQRLYLEAVVIPATNPPTDAVFIHDDVEAVSDPYSEENIDEEDGCHEQSVKVADVNSQLSSSRHQPETKARTGSPDKETIASAQSIFDIPDDSPKRKRTPNPWSRLNRVRSIRNMSRASSSVSFRPGKDGTETPLRAAPIKVNHPVSMRPKPAPAPLSFPFSGKGYVSDSQSSLGEVRSSQESLPMPLAELHKRRYVPPYPKPPKPPVEIVLSSDDEDDEPSLPSALLLLKMGINSASKASPKRPPIRTPKQVFKQTPKPASVKSTVTPRQKSAEFRPIPIQTPASVPVSLKRDTHEKSMSPEYAKAVQYVIDKPSPSAGSTFEQTLTDDFLQDGGTVADSMAVDKEISPVAYDDSSSVASISDWIPLHTASVPEPIERFLPHSTATAKTPIAEDVSGVTVNAEKSFVDYLSDEDPGNLDELDILSTQQLESHMDDVSEDVFAMLLSPPPQPLPKKMAPNSSSMIDVESSPSEAQSASVSEMPSIAVQARGTQPTLFVLPSAISPSGEQSSFPRLKSALKKRNIVTENHAVERKEVDFLGGSFRNDPNNAHGMAKLSKATTQQQPRGVSMPLEQNSATPRTVQVMNSPVVAGEHHDSRSAVGTLKNMAPAAITSPDASPKTGRTPSSRKRSRRKARRSGESVAGGQPGRDVAPRSRDVSVPGRGKDDLVDEQSSKARRLERKRKKRAERKKQQRAEKKLARLAAAEVSES